MTAAKEIQKPEGQTWPNISCLLSMSITPYTVTAGSPLARSAGTATSHARRVGQRDQRWQGVTNSQTLPSHGFTLCYHYHASHQFLHPFTSKVAAHHVSALSPHGVLENGTGWHRFAFAGRRPFASVAAAERQGQALRVDSISCSAAISACAASGAPGRSLGGNLHAMRYILSCCI